MKYLLATIALIVLRIYHPWFDFTKTLSSGDWPNLYRENIQGFSLFPQAPFLWLEPYYNLTAKFGTLLFSWEITEKLFWFIPFIIISIIGSWLFAYSLLTYVRESSYRKVFAGLGSLIYISNTYILMIVGGGQMGVGIAYSLAPLILYLFFNFINAKDKLYTKEGLIVGIVSGIQLMFDPRVYILTFFCIFIFMIVVGWASKFNILKKVTLIALVGISLNLFWIVPNTFSYKDFYNDAVTEITIQTLSFANFSNSVSLLHPNWPENIFGKIGFMRSEFLLIPILAYSTLLFISKIKNQELGNDKIILYFAILGLFGAFFAKGVNPPFGEIYILLSQVPGFLIFRDPTKWYLLIAISYSILIPYLISKLTKGIIPLNLLIIMFLFFWVFIIRQAIFGQLSGTFNPQTLPVEYNKFKDFLISQPDNFSTLWIPTIQRFGYSSREHPAFSGLELLNVSTPSALLRELDNPDVKKILKDAEIRYVIVPYDSKGEIFLTDRKYDNNLYINEISKFRNISWLAEVNDNDFGRIKVFKVSY